VHPLKNLELAHYVNRLQDEKDELRKMMGWLSGHEPQLRMMMETYKRYDGQSCGSEKFESAVVKEERRLVIPNLKDRYGVPERGE
jgi:hypothetical protein